MIAPVQRAEGLAKKHNVTMYVYSNPDCSRRAKPYVISDLEPAPDVWPVTVVRPDGRHARRPQP